MEAQKTEGGKFFLTNEKQGAFWKGLSHFVGGFGCRSFLVARVNRKNSKREDSVFGKVDPRIAGIEPGGKRSV